MTKQRTTNNGHSGPRITRLFNGDFVKVRGVSPTLIDRVQADIKDPVPPMVELDDGDLVENPNDPTYHRKLKEAEDLRGRAVLRTIITFGLELCDEEGNLIDAPDGNWEYKLKKLGIDWKKEAEETYGELDDNDLRQARNEAYLLNMAVSVPDMELINSIAAMPEVLQRQAEEMFQR